MSARVVISIKDGISRLAIYEGYAVQMSLYAVHSTGAVSGLVWVRSAMLTNGLDFAFIQEYEARRLLADLLNPLDFARPALKVAA